MDDRPRGEGSFDNEVSKFDNEAFTTVTLSRHDLTAAAGLLALLLNEHGSLEALLEPKPSPTQLGSRNDLAERARKTLTDRRRRGPIFGSFMFGEPAWEMLLVLYVGDEMGARQSIGQLASLSKVQLTTAIRWLDRLDQLNLVRRTPHPNDKRKIFVELTDKARSKLDSYFSKTEL
ncbi:MAG TPA: MarR family transcriptional regulator [Sphingomicrobium sp.]|nr:MarR family transcriptional regulator [Sphingomicrobium sp.]